MKKGGIGLVSLGIQSYALMLMIFIGISSALNDYEMSGFAVDTSQSVEGVGFTNTWHNINIFPDIFQSHGAGSGYFSYESSLKIKNFTIYNDLDDDLSVQLDNSNNIIEEQSIERKETTNFAYTPIPWTTGGTLKLQPIKALWRESTAVGNEGGTSIKLGFDNIRSLSKDADSRVSGEKNFQSFLDKFDGSFKVGMKYNANFAGNEFMSISQQDVKNKPPTRIMEEDFSGSFSISRNLQIGIHQNADYYIDDETACWIPCICTEELDDRISHKALEVFNCTGNPNG